MHHFLQSRVTIIHSPMYCPPPNWLRQGADGWQNSSSQSKTAPVRKKMMQIVCKYSYQPTDNRTNQTTEPIKQDQRTDSTIGHVIQCKLAGQKTIRPRTETTQLTGHLSSERMGQIGGKWHWSDVQKNGKLKKAGSSRKTQKYYFQGTPWWNGSSGCRKDNITGTGLFLLAVYAERDRGLCSEKMSLSETQETKPWDKSTTD